MKKFIFSCVAIGLLIVGGMFYMLNRSATTSEMHDIVEISASKPLVIKDIKIEYGFNSMKRKSDIELFKDRNRYTILFDGELKDTLRSKYGENDFLVTYDSTYYLAFRQAKSWGKSSHT